MIDGLKPYPEYKKSGLPWLQAIPSHWQTARNGNLFQQRNDTRHPDLPLLEVSLRTGVRVRDFGESKRKQVMADAAKYKRAAAGDVAYNMMRMWQGAVGVAPVDGLVSPAYVVARPFNGIEARYYTTLFRHDLYMGEIDAASRGIVKDRNRLYWDQFKQMRSLLPPPDEQAAIVRFLDHANRKIDRFIRAKRKLIALLNEQKQAIIHQAVTRGLDPNVKLKPSGIPWLGDIPSHWGIVRNMALFAHRVEPGVSGLPVLQVSLRSGITAEDVDQFGRPKRLIADATKYKRIHKGDVAYNTMRMWQGAVGVSPGDGLVSPAYVVLKPRNCTCPEFYDFVFHTEVYKQQVNRQSTGIVSDRNRLYWDDFKQMPNVILPCNEQESIVALIARESAPLTTAIARTEREISLMQEYRTRLTADVVTGKLDVREAAKRLPDQPDDLLLDDDLEGDDIDADMQEEAEA
jgi:type I restriction enzyme S subunit